MTTDTPPAYALRPFLPADAIALRELFAQSIEELTQDDYDEEQRLAWMAAAEDGQAFAARLAGMLTLVIQVGDEYAGFGALKDNRVLDMLFVHPYHAGQHVGTALADALERIAAARGASEITVESSDTAQPFFEDRGYVAVERRMVPRDDQWLAATTMKKQLSPAGPSRAGTT